MSWGKIILLVIIAFLAGMGYMVYVAMQQSNEMYDKDYYSKEVAYQDEMEATMNLNKLYEGKIITITEDTVILTLPESSFKNLDTGTITFFRSNDIKLDKQFSITINQQGKQSIAKSAFEKGYYNARVEWRADGKKYFREEAIYINE